MIAVFAGNRFASMIIVNSQATASAFLAQGGRSDKVRIVYCGLDPTSFDAVGPETAAALRARICPPECYLIGIFGRLAEWKGQHVLLEAVSALPQVHIAVVGDALFGEDTYKSRLMDRAQQPDLVNRIHFLGFRENIAELMKCVDLIAHTSVAPEPFGRVIVEGMLARKPIIASNGGGAAEIIQNGRSGLLTQPGSVEELRSAIVRVHADSVLASRLAVEARLRAEELFLLSGMVEGIQTLIAEVRHRGKHG
jgi:glycosyltransferase involved in cell wall biosynthesis